MPFCNTFRGQDNYVCGLVHWLEDLHLQVPVPLRKVDIRAKTVGFVAEIEVEQEYVNREARPIQATYLFPVEEEAAVVEFQAFVDEREIKTMVKEKETAKKEYDEAVKAEKTAVLLESTHPDVFKIQVGHLKPGASARVIIRYVSELPVEEKAVRLTVPTTIAPRYVPPTDNSEAAKQLSSIKYSMDSPAPLIINVETKANQKIKSVTSPSHKLAIEQAQSMEHGMYTMKSKLQGTITDMDRDFLLLIEAENIHDPVVFIESHNNSLAGMVSLVPSFKLKDQPFELIFCVDRSGSMGWGGSGKSSIEQAKDALELFLHSLPADCFFNIYSFGSRFDSLFPASAEYNDDTLEKAKSHVRGMQADYGGTEIYKPLEAIYKQPLRKGYVRQVFVLTDGAVSNSDQVIALVKKNQEQGRLFALGLGDSASRHLVKGIARAGSGTAVFSTESEDLRPKVMSQLKNGLQPMIKDVKLEWIGVADEEQSTPSKVPKKVETEKTLLGYNKPKEEDVKLTPSTTGQAPYVLPPVYDGHRLLAYRLFTGQDKPTGVKITADSVDGPLTVNLAIKDSDHIQGRFVHQLAARKRIQDLEEDFNDLFDDELKKQTIIRLGMEHSLASAHTSFVGVDPKATDKKYLAMADREVGSQVPHGFGGANMQMACSMPPVARSRRLCGPMMMMKQCSAPPPPQIQLGRAMEIDSVMTMDQSEPVTSRQPVSSDSSEEEEDNARDGIHTSPTDTIDQLVRLQKSSGLFTWGPALEAELGRSQDLVLKEGQDQSEEVWITVLVVQLLRMRQVQHKDLWELVVEKAEKYLHKQLDESGQFDVVMKKAESYINQL